MTTQVADYALERTPREYERLRTQARTWEPATARLLDRIALRAGASCLDAGCGPGETMRLLASRVGLDGAVTGVDVDAALGSVVESSLHADGLRQCRFRAADLTADTPVPGAPYDLVFARLLLFHLPQRVQVLTRLWAAVAPGGHLLVQDYDLRSISTLPELGSAAELGSVAEAGRVINGAFGAVGADVSAGARLPLLFAQAGVGTPDGTDVTGRIEPLATGRIILERVFHSLLPTAVAHGVTTEAGAAATLAGIDQDASRFADRPMLHPLLIGAWKQKEQS